MRSRVIFLGFLLAGVLLGLSLLVSCGGKSGELVAKVGSIEITVEDYNRQYLAISLPRRPRNLNTMEGKRSFLNDIINKEILAFEATKRGFGDDPALARTMKFLTDQQVLEALKQIAVEDKIEFKPGELRDLYDRQDKEYHVQLLAFRDREVAEEALRDIRAGAPFGDFVGKSILPSVDMDWRTWGDFDDPLNAEVFNLEAGQFTDIIPVPGGDLVVAKVVGVRPKENLGTFEEMRSRLMDRLAELKRRALFREWAAECKETYRIEVDGEVAERILSRFVWKVDAAGQDVRPDFTPEEETLVLGTYRGGQLTVGAFLDELMLNPITARPAAEMGLAEFMRTMQGILMNKALLADGYAQGFHERPDIQKKMAREREKRMVTTLYDNVIRGVTITSQEVEEYYEDYKDSFRMPEKYEVSRIVTLTETGSKNALSEIRSGKSFEDVARLRSRDQSAPNGGRLSPVTVDVFPPQVKEVVVSLKTGQIGGPVLTDDGWMLIRLDGHTAERQMSLEETEEDIRSQLLQARQADVFDVWLQQKRQEMGVEIFEEVLAKIELVADQPGSTGESEAEGGARSDAGSGT